MGKQTKNKVFKSKFLNWISNTRLVKRVLSTKVGKKLSLKIKHFLLDKNPRASSNYKKTR